MSKLENFLLNLSLPAFILMLIGFLFVVLFTLLSLRNHIEAPVKIAQHNQIRSDLSKISCDKAAEDVIGQAVESNKKLVTVQRYNKMFFIGLGIPDVYDTVELIDVNSCIK